MRMSPGWGALVLVISAGAQVGLTAFGGIRLWGVPAWLRLVVWLPIVIAEIVVLLAAWRWRGRFAGKLLLCCSIPPLVMFSQLPFMMPKWQAPGVLNHWHLHARPGPPPPRKAVRSGRGGGGAAPTQRSQEIAPTAALLSSALGGCSQAASKRPTKLSITHKFGGEISCHAVEVVGCRHGWRCVCAYAGWQHGSLGQS